MNNNVVQLMGLTSPKQLNFDAVDLCFRRVSSRIGFPAVRTVETFNKTNDQWEYMLEVYERDIISEFRDQWDLHVGTIVDGLKLGKNLLHKQ